MLANERRTIIKQILDEEKTVTVKVLSNKLNVTMETIRSDLDYLSKKKYWNYKSSWRSLQN